jgi:hypothetical protein
MSIERIKSNSASQPLFCKNKKRKKRPTYYAVYEGVIKHFGFVSILLAIFPNSVIDSNYMGRNGQREGSSIEIYNLPRSTLVVVL